MSSLLKFPWPKPDALQKPPRWDGSQFLCGSDAFRVLAYSTEQSHWSESLTKLHETEAGRDHPIDVASRKAAVKTMQKLVDRKSIILDVGCSSGFVLEDLKQALPEASLIGADYLRGPLDGLAARMADIPILQFDLRQCPLPNNCIDGVTCLNVLEHIDNDQIALEELHRILKPGGVVHLEVPAGPGLYDIYDEHLLHHRRYHLRVLREKVQSAGFRVSVATHLGFLMFPAFAICKILNKKKLRLDLAEKSVLVSAQIRTTKSSKLLRAILEAESKASSLISYPFGIRCIIVADKPTNC